MSGAVDLPSLDLLATFFNWARKRGYLLNKLIATCSTAQQGPMAPVGAERGAPGLSDANAARAPAALTTKAPAGETMRGQRPSPAH